ncbi:MAG: GNAT family N-acetyltransferase [Chloroflexi bacterium]|nr:GNAT family N-acetyltransferase [Chloroflexota bacterium]MCY3938106.1 GNAT family N-acetyltransferase [Chloroflexota bacterium]
MTLRPLTEADWDLLLGWNNDPEVMKYADANDFEETTRQEVQAVYRWISTHAFCFVMEVDGRPIGECWLQRMNLQRIVDQFPGEDLRRIDLAIGEKQRWGSGYGTEAIDLLVEFGFEEESASAIFGLVLADNRRSLRAFQKNGFRLHGVVEGEDGTVGHDLIVRRKERRSSTP